MIDPPPFSTNALRMYGVPPSQIDKIIITHCHADHDAGAFQKIQSASRIEFVTTNTIMGSFVRKYSALANMSEHELQNFFEFRPVTIGHKQNINGAIFEFFYSFHAIPCIGFECSYAGKKIYFSGDTYFDPEGLKVIYEKGVFPKGRYEMLAERNFEQYDVILHESGVAPIHTPIKVLQNLSDKIKKNLYLVHVSAKDMLNSGLKKAPTGLLNTIVLKDASNDDSLMKNLELLSGMELFYEMPLRRIYDLLNCVRTEKYKQGQEVCKKGSKGFDFYIVKSGIAMVHDDAPGHNFHKYYYTGDYFGESALSGDGHRLANVEAYTDCELLTLGLYDFKWIFGPTGKNLMQQNTKVMENQNHLRDLREGELAEIINKNRFISKITDEQKNEINCSLKEKFVEKDEYLWKINEECNFCFFIVEGEYELLKPGEEKNCIEDLYNDKKSVKQGCLIGDFPNMIMGRNCNSTVRCITEKGLVLVFPKPSLIQFLSRNPGLYVFLKEKLIIM